MPEPITPAAATPQAPAPAAPVKPSTPQAPVKPESTKPASQTPGAPVTPPAEESKTVPISALHEEREKRQQVQAELEAMRKVAGQNVLFDINGNPVQVQQPQQQQPQQDYRQEIEKAWETDPKRAVQMEIFTAMAWRDQQEARIDAQEADIARKYPDFNTYRPEVRQYLRSVPLEQRANPGVVEMAYYVVRGQKVDSIIAKTREGLEAEYMAKMGAGQLGQSLPGGSMGQIQVPQGAVTLSPDQKNACMALGISEADYVKFMAPGGK